MSAIAPRFVNRGIIPEYNRATNSKCLRCGHSWLSRVIKPMRCSRCKSPRWNIPRRKRRSSTIIKEEEGRLTNPEDLYIDTQSDYDLIKPAAMPGEILAFKESPEQNKINASEKVEESNSVIVESKKEVVVSNVVEPKKIKFELE